MIKKLCAMRFLYDAKGYGNLEVFCGEDVLDRLTCRTGSINRYGKLQNALAVGDYTLREKSVATKEAGMWINDSSKGRKIRLFIYDMQTEKWEPTHLLIHPDGGLGGTLGCIGIIGTNAPSLFIELDRILDEQKSILLTVGTKK